MLDGPALIHAEIMVEGWDTKHKGRLAHAAKWFADKLEDQGRNNPVIVLLGIQLTEAREGLWHWRRRKKNESLRAAIRADSKGAAGVFTLIEELDNVEFHHVRTWCQNSDVDGICSREALEKRARGLFAGVRKGMKMRPLAEKLNAVLQELKHLSRKRG